MTDKATKIFESAFANVQIKGRSWATTALDSTSKSLQAAAAYLNGLSAKLAVPANEDAPAEPAEAVANG